ncbi:uncharacterized protein (DUF2062 family) [Neobacillus bataviensis]|uniref:Uncharacterized protein (DUF2062 family) n=1 Tax=Neobacillus bataviensis TaxID=220685 RepID=A0A561DXZ7_9BACI|nr:MULTISPECIES: DUF2062 domain-containing protein [Bacillaceae]PFO08330.1 group-specific protein [Bacillus sp. AFS076308]PGV50660.1 group-specific protein [Bacillus sp. AFS037270]TWE08239.1 uncharacterized protein (DUF2062 family) [Neobacillus bataviensis]
MSIKHKKHNFFQRLGRAFKLNFLKLLRSPGGAKKVSLGFAIGFGLEMLVISSASLIYILFVPIVRLAKGSLPASIIGNVIGKLTLLPVILLPFARKLGKLIFPMKVKLGHNGTFSFQKLLHGDFHSLVSLIHGGFHALIGMTIFGIILSVISYFIVHYFYEKERVNRLKRRRNKSEIRIKRVNKNFI